MDPRHLSNQEKLDHVFDMVRELNEEMHHLKRRNAIDAFFRFLYMLIIVGSLIGTYFYLRPILDPILTAPAKFGALLQGFDQYKSMMNSNSEETVSPEMIEKAAELIKNVAQ